MAATNYTPISLYYSATATNVPLAANLVAGELAINTNDGKLFYKDSSGVVQVMASQAGSVNVSSFSAGTTGFTPNTATTGAVTLAGTLATTNGGTGLTSFTAKGVVYASSSSALATGSALTFDGTNFGIGTSSPSTKLDAVAANPANQLGGQIAVSSSTAYATGNVSGIIFRANDSSASLSTYASIQMKTTGDNAGDLTFVTRSSAGAYDERMRLDSSGNLGLGVTPSAWDSGWKALDIYTVSSYTGSATGTDIWHNAKVIGGSPIYKTTAAASFYRQSAGVNYWFNAPSGTAGNTITFTQAMTLDASGNLGVGITSPSVRLAVSDASNANNGTMRLGSTANGVYGEISNKASSTGQLTLNSVGSGASDGIAFQIEGSTKALIDSSGNLGLGVTPSAWGSPFKVFQTSGGVNFAGRTDAQQLNASVNWYYDGGTNKYIANGYATRYVQESGGNYWYNAPSGTAGNAITFTQAMTLDGSGNLLVGTTSQVAQGKISVVYSNTVGQGLCFNENSGSGLTRDAVRFQTSGTQVGSISVSTTATAYVTSSDYRLKNTVAPMTGALAKVAALKPVTYKWNTDGSDGEGFIAHELAEVCPHAVAGVKDAVDADGKPQYQGIDASFLIATLTAAIQELKAEFDAYKSTHP